MHFSTNFCIYLIILILNHDQCIQKISAAANTLSDATNDIQKRRDELTKAREELNREIKEFEDEKKLMENFLKDSVVIQFNVGGEIMYITRANLLRISNSKLAQILLDQSTEPISLDEKNNKFFDFNPTLFRHLLEQIRLLEDNEPAVFYPSSKPLLAEQFKAMLKQLGLQPASDADDDIFTFNVGDEIVATTRKTLNSIPGSKLSSLMSLNKPEDMDANGRPFLDYDPKLFRHLLSQIQAGQKKDFEAPDQESKLAFNAMLTSLGLTSK